MSPLPPVWRCEACGYWLPRNGEPHQNCPECSFWERTGAGHKRINTKMAKAVRLAPPLTGGKR